MWTNIVCVRNRPRAEKKPMWPMRLLERGALNCFEEFSSINWLYQML